MSKELVISGCNYFFEVLVKNFLEVEKSIQKQSGLLSIFKKIDFSERAGKFKNLNSLAFEAKSSLPSGDLIRGDAELFTLNSKLIESYSLYLNMTEVQHALNMGLHGKTLGSQYPINEYNKHLEFFDMVRSALESELPKLTSLYSSYLTENFDSTHLPH